MWFIGVEVEQETSAPSPKKILDPPLPRVNAWIYIRYIRRQYLFSFPGSITIKRIHVGKELYFSCV